MSDLVTVEVTLGGAASRAVPIPRRERKFRELDVGNGTTFKAGLSHYRSEFVEQAERNSDVVGKSADHVPFKAYWSSYEDMDTAQSRWYYFWRNEVRNGRFPPTDLSYVFIHIYECLHGIGFDTILHAYGHLWTVWHNYRHQHPRLDGYLMRWMLDLNAYYEIGMNPIEIVGSTPGAATSGVSSDLLAASMESLRGDNVPTLTQIALISNYNPRSGKFYQEFPDTDLIDRTLVSGFKALDDYFRETSHVGVLKAHEPKRTVKVQHSAFAGAVFGYESKQLLIAEVSAYSSLKKLPKLIEDALKLSENILRKQVSFAGQRRGIDLPSAIEERIRSVLGSPDSRPVEQVAKRRVLKIDPALASALEEESLEIRAALIASMSSEPIRRAQSARFKLPEDRKSSELTDVDKVAGVLDALSSGHLALVHAMRGADWEQQLADRTQIQEINKHAVRELGEPLVVVEGESQIVVDDYRDELEFLLALRDYTPVVEPTTEPEEETADDGWSALRATLTALQLAALAKLVDGCNRSDFDAFAFEHGVMGALLVDEINEVALGCINDTLVHTEGDSLTVFDEYKTDTRHLVEA